MLLTDSLSKNAVSLVPFDRKASSDRNESRASQSAVLLSMDRYSRLGKNPYDQQARSPWDRDSGSENGAVEIFPPDSVKRRGAAWDGVAVEVVQATRHDKIEYRFRAPLHLLVVYEQGVRSDGETLVEGLPRSTLRYVKRK